MIMPASGSAMKLSLDAMAMGEDEAAAIGAFGDQFIADDAATIPFIFQHLWFFPFCYFTAGFSTHHLQGDGIIFYCCRRQPFDHLFRVGECLPYSGCWMIEETFEANAVAVAFA